MVRDKLYPTNTSSVCMAIQMKWIIYLGAKQILDVMPSSNIYRFVFLQVELLNHC